MVGQSKDDQTLKLLAGDVLRVMVCGARSGLMLAITAG